MALEAFVHLTSNVSYPLLLLLGILLLPVLLGARETSPWIAWTIQAGVWIFGVIPTLLFLVVGQREAGARWSRIPRDVGLALVVAIGLSLNNTRGVLEGLGAEVGSWERTPKTSDQGLAAPPRSTARGPGWRGTGEICLALYFALVCLLAWQDADRQ